jgi:hypothetical protein
MELIVTPPTWNALEIRRRVEVLADRLERLDLTNCSQTNDELARALAPHCGKLRRLSLAGCTQLTSTGLSELVQHCTRLEEVNLAGCARLTDDGIVELALHVSTLTSLDLGSCPLVTSASVGLVTNNNPALLYLTPGFLRAIPQAEELAAEAEVAESLPSQSGLPDRR